MPDLTDAIEEVAAGPASASGAAGSISQQSLQSLIEADRYLKGNEAATSGASAGNFLGRALRRARAVPPSALGE